MSVNLWINNIRECFEDLADIEYQKVAWVQGLGKYSYACYAETCCRLFDDYNFISFVKYLRSWGFSVELVNAFEKFNKELRQFEKEVDGNGPDWKIVGHPKWPLMVKNAQIALLMLDEECLKLNISDDLLLPPFRLD